MGKNREGEGKKGSHNRKSHKITSPTDDSQEEIGAKNEPNI